MKNYRQGFRKLQVLPANLTGRRTNAPEKQELGCADLSGFWKGDNILDGEDSVIQLAADFVADVTDVVLHPLHLLPHPLLTRNGDNTQ